MLPNRKKSISRPGTFYVDGHLVQPELNRVIIDEKIVRLEPMIMDVLVYLTERCGDVVGRDELLDSVWAGSVVGEEVVFRAISTLRKVFNDDVRAPKIIETISKGGYRFIAHIEVANDSRNEASYNLKEALGRLLVAEKSISIWRRGWIVMMCFAVVAVGAVYFSLGRGSLALNAPTPLTSFPGQEFSPALSPDGSQVAFVWSGDKQGHLDIYVKVVETETPLQLTETPLYEYGPTWSPDGTQIAFVRSLEGIFVVPVTGGPEKKLLDVDAGKDIDWSPTGEYIAYTKRTKKDASPGIFLLLLETLESEPFTAPNKYEHDQAPVFSPDGLMLAFVRSAGGANEIYLAPVAGGEPVRLTSDHMNIKGLTWSADGDRLIFSSDRSGTFGLWQISIAGETPPKPLMVTGGDLKEPAMARLGGKLAYTQSMVETNIWRSEKNEDGWSAKPFLSSTRRDINPRYSPDGSNIAFISSRTGPLEVWLSRADGAGLTQVTDLGSSDTGLPQWSPDGAQLAFTSSTDGQADVYVIDIEGGAPRRVTDHASIDLVSSWSKDGQWLYFGSNRGDDWEIWKIPVAGGDAVQVTNGGGFWGQESPDGHWLYFSRRTKPGLWRMPAKGGEVELVLDALQDLDWGNWEVVGEKIYYINRSSDRAKVNALNMISGETEVVTNLTQTPYWQMPSLSVSPDEQVILYGQMDNSSHDLVISDVENNFESWK